MTTRTHARSESLTGRGWIRRATTGLLVAMLLMLMACGESYVGTFIDPSGTMWVDIKANGEIRNAAGDTMKYVVGEKTEQGTTLRVTSGERTYEWRVTPDGKELHGASSPAAVVFRRR